MAAANSSDITSEEVDGKQKGLFLKDKVLRCLREYIDIDGESTAYHCIFKINGYPCTYFQRILAPANFKRHCLSFHPEEAIEFGLGQPATKDDATSQNEVSFNQVLRRQRRINKALRPKKFGVRHKEKQDRSGRLTIKQLVINNTRRTFDPVNKTITYSCKMTKPYGMPCNYIQTTFAPNNFRRHMQAWHTKEWDVIERQWGIEEASSNVDEKSEDGRQPSSHSAVLPAKKRGVGPQFRETCCVPGCINDYPEYITRFPRAPELVDCWQSAIETGTGKRVPESLLSAGASVCNMHFFGNRQSVEDADIDDAFREPTLFYTNDVMLQVACCRFCLKYDTVEEMYSLDKFFEEGTSLGSAFSRFFESINFVRFKKAKEYFCKHCMVRFDMMQTFWAEVDHASELHKTILGKKATERVVFKRVESCWKTDACIKWQRVLPLSAMDPDTVSDNVSGLEYIIIKEETQMSDWSLEETELFYSSDRETTEKIVETNDTVESTQPLINYAVAEPTNDECATKELQFKCYICNNFVGSKHSRDTHISVQHKEPTDKYHCYKCKINFHSALRLNAHLSVHSIKKPFRCTRCPLRFLKIHLKWNHEAAAHGIIYPKLLSEKKYVNKFKQVNTYIKGKPFSCEVCGEQFTGRVQLHLHQKKDCKSEFLPNGMPLATERGGKSRNIPTCNVCQKTFRNVKRIARHFKESHPKMYLRQYRCIKCKAIYFASKLLRKHRLVCAKKVVQPSMAQTK